MIAKLLTNLLIPLCLFQLSPSVLIADHDNWDVGTLSPDSDTVFHDIALINPSKDKTVRIQNVRAWCECVGAVSDTDVLAPGQVAKLTVRFNPRGMSGRVTRYLELIDPEGNSLIKIKLTANINTNPNSL
ncbi:MAG: DUF1573 domain-containing protein [Bacteroidales bacterium]|nr:DUF1573 domain-containing protein [Bacteroidales bacterium]